MDNNVAILSGLGQFGTRNRDQNTFSLSTSGYFAVIYFVAPASGVLSDLALWCSTATAGTRDGKVELFLPDSDLKPTGSALAWDASWNAPSGGSSPLITFDNWASGSSYSVTQGTGYCLKITNNSSTPASNYFTPATSGPRPNGIIGGGVLGSSNYDSRMLGTPLSLCIGGLWYGCISADTSQSATNLTSYPIYGTRKAGSVQVFDTAVKIATVSFLHYRVGTLTSYAQAKIYDTSGNLIATSTNTNVASTATNTSTSDSANYFAFNDASLPPNTPYRFVEELSDGGGDSSNYLVLKGNTGMTSSVWPTDQSRVLDGLLGGTYYNGTSWTDYTDSSTVVIPKVMITGSIVGGGDALIGANDLVVRL